MAVKIKGTINAHNNVIGLTINNIIDTKSPSPCIANNCNIGNINEIPIYIIGYKIIAMINEIIATINAVENIETLVTSSILLTFTSTSLSLGIKLL